MVKLRGPSLAQDAAGGLGKAIIFSKSKGRSYAKRWAKPANPKTGSQTAMRAIVAFLSQLWSHLPAGDQATWSNLAAAANVSNFNACQAFNLKRWRRFAMPATRLPASGTGTLPTWTLWNVVTQNRTVVHEFGASALNDGIGWLVHIDTTGAFPQTWDNLAFIQPILPFTSPFFYTLKLDPGTYWFSAASLANDGVRRFYSYRGPFTIS